MSHSRKNSTSSVINRSPNGTDSLSLSFLHKKRHSDSSIDNKTPSPTDSITSIPKLIRKKSGELVKSNLKLNCLQNAGLSKSMPTTPIFNKSVHFGQDVDVRYFNELDKPTAVSASGSPILKGRGRRRGSGASRAKPGKFKFGFGFDDYDSVDDSDSDSDDDEFDFDGKYDITWDLETVNFGKIKYNEKISSLKSLIFLERISIDEDLYCILGSIAVKNLSFEKKIHIRYTFDNWKTVVEIESFYIEDAPKILKRSNYDRFKFKINLMNFQFSQQDEIKLNFCIRYRYKLDNNKVGGGVEHEVWDNNDYKNYEILIKRTKTRRFNKSSHKFILNDYFTGQLSSGKSIEDHHDMIDSYFNNYEAVLKSPETPKILKNEIINEEEMSPNFELKNKSANENNNETNELNNEITTPMDELSLHKNYTTSTNNNNNQESDILPKHHNTHNFKLNKQKKPPINSKSYQELLDSYCFFKGDDHDQTSTNHHASNSSISGPTGGPPKTIASFLDLTINKN